MAKCPFAQWDEITGSIGDYSGGPFRIVHHTTEGASYEGARSAFRKNRSDPHFTVAGSQVYQHIDTSQASRSLRNAKGGVQTNRNSAVQIEVVGFAGRPKDATTLTKVAELCRWIETAHGIPQVWPNGSPRAAKNGQDPGGHNRDAANWASIGGHYGHSQVPENTHWDPGYTESELAIVTPEAVSEAHREIIRAAVGSFHESIPRPTGDPEQIARQLLRDALEQLHARSIKGRPRVRIRVVSGSSRIEIDVDLGTPARAAIDGKKSRRRKPTSLHRK